MTAYATLLAALLALLVGLTIGKAWERYKLRGGQWIDRRRARESPHYILGLNFLVSNQIDLAIEELTRAASVDAEALEVHMILGNLYREKGQVGKAITVHQTLLQRSKLSRLEHAYVLLCLGLDYKRGGFVDRALEAFNEVLRLDPEERVRAGQLAEAARRAAPVARGVRHAPEARDAVRDRLASPRARPFWRSSRTRSGSRPCGARTTQRPAVDFRAPSSSTRRAVPAYLNLGDVRVAQNREKEAAAIWEKLVQVAPDRAYLAFDRLEALALRAQAPDRFTRLCRKLIEDTPQDWRARLALSRHLTASGQPQEALELLFAALVQNPHALGIHQAIWRALGLLRHPTTLVDRYGELTEHAVFYLDPHICMRCRYRSTELLWQCPHCHDWNTFVEERIAPAQDVTEVEA